MSKKIKVLQRYRDANKAAHPDDEFNKLFGQFSDGSGIKNMGGFRIRKSNHSGTVAFSFLITNANEPEWPDRLDTTNSSFLYYGDKRGEYGRGDDLHNTAAKGNSLLRDTFLLLAKQERHKIAPFLLFKKVNQKNGVYMHFLGLAAPALSGVDPLSCLKAIWHQGMDGEFCMNYEAYFTILDASEVAIQWLDDILQTGNFTESSFCPWAWKFWVDSGSYRKLSFENLLLSSC